MDEKTAEEILQRSNESGYLVRDSYGINTLKLSFVVVRGDGSKRIGHSLIHIEEEKLRADKTDIKLFDMSQLVELYLGSIPHIDEVLPDIMNSYKSGIIILRNHHKYIPYEEPIRVRLDVIEKPFDSEIAKILRAVDYYKYEYLLAERNIRDHQALLKFRENDHRNLFGELYQALDNVIYENNIKKI